jgi:ATP-dependent Clp protease ATP-binding subunit ClpA
MSIPVPRPDHDVRRKIIRSAGPVIAGYREMQDRDPVRLKSLVNRFADQTGGLYAGELVSIASLAAQDRTSFPRISEAVRHYKLGVPDNPWDKLDRDAILGGGELLSKRVLGQGRAISHSMDIIMRSVFDLSGAQFSPHSQKPKGVLFFAGPTGVGKTELAKGITELIFGSPENYVRFDMSEFNQQHSDQRLMGAPPGYVGYEVGGELTNAARQRPFSLILFDEIEKAHPRIMDVFLQILDDGRLTSGRGETAYFTDAVIVFTSNLGVYKESPDGRREALITPDMPYPEVQATIGEAIREHFTFKLHRPEILNRIGKNIVVFDFIRPAVAEGILRKMLSNVLERLSDQRRITLEIDPAGLPALSAWALRDLSMGGRGIGNALEECFVNPLARELYSLPAITGDRIRCTSVAVQDGMPALRLTRL